MRGICVVLVASAGCGFGPFGDTPGGADNLPTAAAGPYAKLPIDFDTPADEPFIVDDARAQLNTPSALPREDGGFRIWFTRDADDAAGTGEIWYTEIPALTELPDVFPDVLLVADQDWEQGDVRDPSVLDLGGGELVMYYGGGGDLPAIGRADSSDGGATWVKHPDNPVLDNAAEPGAAALDGDVFVVFSRPSGTGIAGALSADGGLTFAGTRPVLLPRVATPRAFDKNRVFDPDLVVEMTDTGRRTFGLFYAGEAPGDEAGTVVSAVGYAGSFDFSEWRRFGGGEPILSPGPPGERGPSALIKGTGGVLFFSERKQGRGRIAVATHP